MIRLNVFVRVSETNREKAIEAAKELTTCSLKEEGCIAYDTFESSTRHDVFMICETCRTLRYWQLTRSLRISANM